MTSYSPLYRLRTAVKLTYNASSGKVEYFEDEDRLRIALLEAHLDILANDPKGDWCKSRLAERWRAIPDSDHRFPDVQRVIAVERHTDAGWEPVAYELIAPDVVLAAPSLSPAERAEVARSGIHEEPHAEDGM